MSIATQITRLQTAKSDIKTAIEAKGVTIPSTASIAVYDDYIAQITSGGGSGWNRPADWPVISDCGSNEIFLVVGDMGTGLAFSTTIAASGTYSIDWGDGAIETGRTSGTTYQHQYTIGSGTPCSEGYTTFKVRVFNATNTITGWAIKRHTFTSREQESPILEANIGATGLTNYLRMFYVQSPIAYCRNLRAVKIGSFASATTCFGMFQGCQSLQSVTLPTSWSSITECTAMFSGCVSLASITLPASLGSVEDCSQMFNNCYALTSVTLPTSWGSVTNCSNMFSSCYTLASVTLPTSWGSATNCSYMFYNCYALTSVTLPTSWGSVTNCSYMFNYCYALASVTLPTSWGSVTDCSVMFLNCYSLASATLPTSWGSVTNCSGMFYNCYSLRAINNAQYLGSIAAPCDFSYFMQNMEAFAGEVSIASLISKFGCYGASGYKNKITSIRLTNANSTFGGSSPQINVSYCDLSATALNQLFTDLPALTGKAINITGCTGAATCDKTIATAKNWTVTG